MKRKIHLLFFLSLIAFISCHSTGSKNTEPLPPSAKFNLRDWKLQIPGPKDITDLESYSSKYFCLNENKEMVFQLDASEKGTTKNTVFVRSELRHLKNWQINENHKMSATLQVVSNLDPDKITVLKIHGFTSAGEYAPTLLRIAKNNNRLIAFLNVSSKPKDIRSYVLVEGLEENFFYCEIIIKNSILTVKINDVEKLRRDVSYWMYSSYFKAGCYPQSHNGTVKVIFRKLEVE